MVSSIPAQLVNNCYALLDDCDASGAEPRSRLYTGCVGVLEGEGAADLPALLERLRQALRDEHHAVTLFSYELGASMHGVPPRDNAPSQVLLFERCEFLSSQQVEQWLCGQTLDRPQAGVAQLTASVTEQEFAAAVARIHEYIEAGDTYQINYTYRWRFDAYGSPAALYRRLRQRQPVPYGALIALPGRRAVLSLSPELFIRHRDGTITARPMKGTAAATGNEQQDAERAVRLAADPKNRAENLMIVDLLRNDLGRVAALGSVRVPKLFSVDRYSSVLQMTSTVEAELRDGLALTDIFDALYPCGSITGAPKRRTMQIIRELEKDARGLYTGAIGWFDAADASKSLGNFCLSVPIRTLVLDAPDSEGLRKGEMGVGAGIVHDSIASEEFAECALKASFLTGLRHDFELFETMHATGGGGCRHLDLHLQRLRASAAYFGFVFEEKKIRDEIAHRCAALGDGSHRLRLALQQDGGMTLQTAPLTPVPAPVNVLMSREPTESSDFFLRHKSSVRAQYDAGWRQAEERGGFDTLFFNERGELTEGGRSNVFVKLDGRWVTPPLSAGLLPGVMRSILLGDPAWNAQERVIRHEDLLRAEEIVVCNALRGALPARLVRD